MEERELFRRCRHALALSQDGMGRALLVTKRTIRRWEQGDWDVAGPAWVALAALLEKASEDQLAAEVNSYIERRRIHS